MRPVHQVLRGLPIQAKLKVGAPNDAYEQEADRVADRVMSASWSPAAPVGGQALVAPGIQRLCSECEEEAATAMPLSEQVQRQPQEEEEEVFQAKGLGDQVQRQAEEEEEEIQTKREGGGEASLSSGLSRKVAGLNGGGRPLPAPLRAFYEPRFGTDFSDVNLHTDAQAGGMARALRARAFTRGTDIVFGQGEYAPDSWRGRHLLAHELTHVVQQRQGAGDKAVRRWSYGTGAPADPTYVVVPEDEKKRVDAGMGLVKRVADNPKRYPRCHKRFADLCSSPAANELLARHNAAVVWKETSTDPRFKYGSSVGPDHIAYTALTWRWGRWMIASTLLHEMMHRCGFHDEGELLKTERICGFPGLP